VQCLVGTLAGIGAGFVVLINLSKIVTLLTKMGNEVFPKEIYGLGEIPWEVSTGDLTSVCILVMVVCTVTCAIPVLRAALLDPVEAFRQE